MARPVSQAVGSPDLYQEESLGKAYDARLMRRLWGYIRPYSRDFWISMVCLPLATACSLLQPYLLKLAIDRYIATRNGGGLPMVAAIYALAMVAEFSFFYAQYYLTMVVAQRSLADLRRALFSHMQQLPAEFFDRNP